MDVVSYGTAVSACAKAGDVQGTLKLIKVWKPLELSNSREFSTLFHPFGVVCGCLKTRQNHVLVVSLSRLVLPISRPPRTSPLILCDSVLRSCFVCF